MGRGRQHTATRDRAGQADASAGEVSRDLAAEYAGQILNGVEQVVGTPWRPAPVGGDDVIGVVNDDAETLGAPDVDAEVQHRFAGAQDSARDFNSRIVLRMRTSARRFTNPGSGATSSMSRSYLT